MKKSKGRISLIICVVAFITIFMGSCSLFGGILSREERLSRDVMDDEERANAIMEQMFDAIKEKDKEKLREIFSAKALSEINDFDRDAEQLFNFIQGDLGSWEKLEGIGSAKSINYGHRTNEIKPSFYLYTNSNKYYFALKVFSIDTDDPDNVGTYYSIAIRDEDYNELFDPVNKMYYEYDDKGEIQELPHVGIYIPIE